MSRRLKVKRLDETLSQRQLAVCIRETEPTIFY